MGHNFKISSASQKFILLAALSTLVCAIIIFFIYMGYMQIEASYRESELKAFSTQINSTMKTYSTFSQYVYKKVVDDPQISSILFSASHQTGHLVSADNMASLRKTLAARLNEDYALIQDFNFRQLHFILPTGESFYRFHAPDRFGDNLTEERESIRLVNAEKHFVSGFEEGKIYNGYRFVYPLFYNREQVGAVEVSVSMATVMELLYNLHPKQDFLFLVDAHMVRGQVFEEMQSNYLDTTLSEHLLLDKDVQQRVSNLEGGIFKHSKDNFLLVLKEAAGTQLSEEKWESFVVHLDFEGNHYIALFSAIKNIKGKPVSYVVALKENNEMGAFENNVMRDVSLILITYALILFNLFISMQSHKRLTAAKVAAESANKAKGQFLANMSHEIRTPLNGILGYLSLINKGRLDNEQLELVKSAQLASVQLKNVIGDILDFSKIDAGKMTVTYTEVEIHQLLQDTLDMHAMVAKQKQIYLQGKISKNLPRLIITDDVKLKQVLDNILSNAVKFTLQGGVSVDVDYGNDTLEVAIQDTGIGMNAHELDMAFDIFQQVDTSHTRNFGGTGLGLAIVKELLALMEGSIEITSEKGIGTHCKIIIPARQANKGLAAASDLANKADLQAEGSQNKVPLKVLVAEDQLLNQKLVVLMLDKLGVSSHVVNNGQEALDAYMHYPYAVILMDCQMPVMDGFESARAIRAYEAANLEMNLHTKIIAVTANALDDDIKRCFDAGMDLYLSKPIDISNLEAYLKS